VLLTLAIEHLHLTGVIAGAGHGLPARVRAFIDWVVALYVEEVKAAEAFMRRG
jgi:hypothetical protein